MRSVTLAAWLMCLGALLSLSAARSADETPCLTRFTGVWEYRQAAGESVDSEGERLELTCSRKGLRGVYYGLEREGDEGLFYTAVEVRNLTITGDDIAFVVPERALFSTRPHRLETVIRKELRPAGVTRDELSFHGRLDHQKLVLTCAAKMSTCPDGRMIFHRSSS
jgi:hypothetical protein